MTSYFTYQIVFKKASYEQITFVQSVIFKFDP